jgi:multidrug resistance efflux pump
MKKIIPLLLLSFIIISSCWSDSEEKSTDIKKIVSSVMKSQNFIIETQNYDDFENVYQVKKSAKILPNQNISVKSEATWKVWNILVREWDEVYIWQRLVLLNDDYSKYSLDLEKSEINLERSKINLESQTISLEKNIIDAKLNLEKAQSNYDINKVKYEEDLKKADLDYLNSQSGVEGTSTSLALEKLEENLKKSELDYNNTLESNKQQLNTYIESIKTEYRDILIDLRDIINFSDEIFWITDDNKDKNNSFDNYLWAKDSQLKNQTKLELISLIDYENKLLDFDINLTTEENILESVNSFYNSYWNIWNFLNNFELVLWASISSSSNFTDSDINSYKTKINSYQSTINNAFSSYINTKNSITTFLNTYKDKEELALKQLELTKKDKEISEKNYDDWGVNSEISYNKIVLSIKNDIKTLENNLALAKLNYETTIKNKEVTMRSLENSIADSRNSYSKTVQEYSKLTIISPINWVISEVLIDEWQNISNGNQILTIIWDSESIIELTISDLEYKLINSWDVVRVKYKNRELLGKVYSKSNLADTSLNYKVKIILDEKVMLVWNVVDIIFDIDSKRKVLPIDLVDITWNNEWVINVYSSWSLKKIQVRLWRILKQKIEILWVINNDKEVVPILDNYEIIITDLSKFNEKRNKLVKKWEEIKLKEVDIDSLDKWKEKIDISNMTREERKEYLETLSEDEKQKVMEQMKGSRNK